MSMQCHWFRRSAVRVDGWLCESALLLLLFLLFFSHHNLRIQAANTVFACVCAWRDLTNLFVWCSNTFTIRIQWFPETECRVRESGVFAGAEEWSVCVCVCLCSWYTYLRTREFTIHLNIYILFIGCSCKIYKIDICELNVVLERRTHVKMNVLKIPANEQRQHQPRHRDMGRQQQQQQQKHTHYRVWFYPHRRLPLSQT